MKFKAKFDHLFYKEAGKLYCSVAAGVNNLKKGLFQGNFSSDRKKLYAVVSETLKRREVLREILHRAGLIETPSFIGSARKGGGHTLECSSGEGCEDCSAIVQTYEVLFGKGGEECPMAVKIGVLQKARDDLLKERGLQNIDDMMPKAPLQECQFPIYVRINTLLISKEDAVNSLCESGYEFVDYDTKTTSYEQYVEWISGLTCYQFMPDLHISDLLVFPANTDFHNNQLFIERKILVQDKASCIPAVILAPSPDSLVLDACAAPGNKTSQLAALMTSERQGQGHIIAVDRDNRRFKLMQGLLRTSGCENLVDTQCEDFLKLDPSDPKLSDVEYILLDPSCSGSGIVRQLDRLLEHGQAANPRRLRSLGNFQATLLRHALTFPSVKRVLYSTCSMHSEENEDVVQENLYRYEDKFQLVDIWPDRWPRRGQKGLTSCIRTDPSLDLTNGFFVACFERKGSNEKSLEKDKFAAKSTEEENGDNKKGTKISSGVDIENSEGMASAESAAVTTNDQTGEVAKKKRKKKKKKKKTNETGNGDNENAKCEVLEVSKNPENISDIVNSTVDITGNQIGADSKSKKKRKKKNKNKKKPAVPSTDIGESNIQMLDEKEEQTNIELTNSSLPVTVTKKKKTGGSATTITAMDVSEAAVVNVVSEVGQPTKKGKKRKGAQENEKEAWEVFVDEAPVLSSGIEVDSTEPSAKRIKKKRKN